MREESFLAIKILILIVLLFSGPQLVRAQDERDQQAAWEAAAVARMPEDVRRQYERLKTPAFAQLDLLPRLLELSESPEALSNPYQVGDKIFFRLVITNVSSEKVSFSVADPYYYHRPQLFRDGELVSYRKGLVELLKSKEKSPANQSVRATSLSPHETEAVIVEMNQWYEPLRAGHYVLTVKRRFIWGGEWIESPALNFEVVSK